MADALHRKAVHRRHGRTHRVNVLLSVTIDELAPRIPGPATTRWPQGERLAVSSAHDSMRVELYEPRPTDKQQSHARDELYIVVSGHGAFGRGDARVPFNSHNVLFVPAGMPHRFADVSPDFRTRVVFHHREGGEARRNDR